MQELLPTEQAIFNQLKQNISDVYHHYGFLSIETPLIDRQEILLAKAGGDTEKQIYKVIKTAEDDSKSDQALRFDHTVPLARYVVEHNNDLAFPFSVTQIGRNFRGERAQRGRFREFYQCDVDIIGREKLPIAYDAKVIACIHDALKTFNLPNMVIRISNRKVLAGFLQALNLSDKTGAISNVIDHAEKVPLETTREHLTELGLSETEVGQVCDFMFTNGSYSEIENKLTEILGDKIEAVREGLNELKAQLVAHSHRGYESGDTALLHSSSSLNLSCLHSCMHSVQILAQCCKIQHLGIIARAGQENYLVPCSLKLCRNSLIAVDNAHSEGNQRRRNSFIHKGATHGVLATNGRQLQSIQGSKST